MDPLAEGKYKANVDGAISTVSHSAEVGVIVRKDKGEVMVSMAKPVNPWLSPFTTKLMATKFGFELFVEAVINGGIIDLILKQLWICYFLLKIIWGWTVFW